MKTFYLKGENNKPLANCHVNEYTNDNNDHLSDLISYTIRVASYNHLTNKIQIFGWYSKTTGKHINAFLQFYGFDKQAKSELFKNFNLVK